MTSLLQHARRGFVWPFPREGWESFQYGGQMYFGTPSAGASTPSQEAPPSGYAELADQVFKSNAVVFACEQKRLQIFSEARFVYRRFAKGRPGGLFSLPDLDILEQPWPRGVTGDLLLRMLLHADLGGNAYPVRTVEEPDRIRLLRPDYVTLVLGDRFGRPVSSAAQLDADLIGLIYDPRDGQTEPEALLAREFAHFAPNPDPLARYRGMSWLSPIIREAQADQAATMHKLAFFEQGATPQLAVTFDASVTPEQFEKFVAKMDEAHSGWRNAYKTLYLGGGADVTPVGKDLRQLDFSSTQGKGETRIAAASGIHPVLVPLSEGMQGSSLNAGNYAAARRGTADTTFRPLWRNACGSLAWIVPPPEGAELWWDETGVAFLREDAEDRANIQSVKAQTIRQLIDAGYKPESVVQAVDAEDMSLLTHTGLFSVQLQEPMTGQPALPPAGPRLAIAAGNGSSGD